MHDLTLKAELAKDYTNCAVNAAKFSIKISYLKRQNESKSVRFRIIQRQLFRSISNVEQVIKAQKDLIDNCIGMYESIIIERNISTQQEQESIQQARTAYN